MSSRIPVICFTSCSAPVSARMVSSLTDSALCPSLPFTHSNPSVVTGIPTDVNWAVLKRLDVTRLSCRESDVAACSYAPTRELSDAISALLYNLDSTITL